MSDPVQSGSSVVVSATVVTSNQHDVARAAEVFGRAIAGLALDGISAALNCGVVDDEPDDD